MQILQSLGYQNGSRLRSLKRKKRMMRSKKKKEDREDLARGGINSLFRPHPVRDLGDAIRRGASKVGKSTKMTVQACGRPGILQQPTASLALLRPMIRSCKKRVVISDAAGAAPSGDDGSAICQ